eukprot:CAMPEP_0206533760 /NCGR_PEP_ID=MMETSP0325_2-20121206/5149_1 /ASSEMBLY_ACC=CAM_ASM_000347 /TAXON_ID=2866 /ORGANISM="Crypthecodinium cohnii, Strain Seligo" /LENGTH=471 /DNA_ID=CAMNT_0054030449 /DNA_START=11 /DNA_END=1426 /DNA_ORIENTATION=+
MSDEKAGRNSYTVTPLHQVDSQGRQRTARTSLVQSGHEQPTMADFFMGNRAVHEDHVHVPGEDDLEFDMIVDPPCIAAFEDDDGPVTTKKPSSTGVSPQEYWKAFATFKKDDPALVASRERNGKFVKEWAEKHNLTAALKAKEQGDTSFAELFKRQRSRTRPMTTSFRSGQLEITEAFVNISPYALGIRSMSSAAEDAKTGEVIAPGEAVIVERIMEKDHVRFLKLMDGRGWVFDRTADTTVMARMEEVEIGNYWYRVACKELVDIRRAPVYDAEAKTSNLLCPKELVVVSLKCRVRGGQHFVMLADGRGWVFSTKLSEGKKGKTGKAQGDTVMEEVDAEIVHGTNWMNQADLLPVTSDIVEVGLWTYSIEVDQVIAIGGHIHGEVVKEGDIIKVDKRCWSEGMVPIAGMHSIKWLRLMDGRGWVPEKTPQGKPCAVLKTNGGISYPSTLALKAKIEETEKALPKWAIGIA